MDLPVDFTEDELNEGVQGDVDLGWMAQNQRVVDVQAVSEPKKKEPPVSQKAPAHFVTARKEQHSGFTDNLARDRTRSGFFDAIFAMAIFRCWHILLFYAIYATIVTVFYMKGNKWLAMPSTLLKIAGASLGFIVSYRAAQSFQRYNEGRKLWCQIISTTRTFSRIVWFNVPDTMPQYQNMPSEEQKARALMEKKTVLNLLEAFSVSLKHYLRHEDGIYYTDLYHLVKFLPAYSMPAGIVTDASQHGMVTHDPGSPTTLAENDRAVFEQGLPQPVTVPRPRAAAPDSLTVDYNPNQAAPISPLYSARPSMVQAPASPSMGGLTQHERLSQDDEIYLIPAYKPPRWAILQLWPFSMLAGRRIVSASKATGERARKIRAKIQNKASSHNLPLEISLYLGSYVAALQRRGTTPVLVNLLANSINQLVTSLTGLERILTTPIPYSYRIHLWVILCVYCLLLPHQVVKEMKWFTIPGTILFCAVYFGFLTAGEEIENPFGYCKNDLNLDHFTHNIIRNELMAITSAPPPDPSVWAFSPENNLIFTAHHGGDNGMGERVSPEEWIRRGSSRIQGALRHS